ncbi:hypothetical protein [Bacteroides sp. 519]|uniref:DUF5018-related domain-containing protein n=1 Tax=Bacteroides sp. 519 TaxID=2302937 RepID=UPI0013D12DB9|nr:hypothetical protein [Bacteroides sp. 519]NDV58894.1 hypothetical protein [Bacteroides sp. 519]
MKRINSKQFSWLTILLCMPLLMACGWEDMPAYEEAEISQAVFYYRWDSGKKDAITGEPIVAEKQLSCSSEVDSEQAVVNVTVKIPAADATFTEAIRNQVTQKLLWGTARISTAARIAPTDGAPELGTPGDWTHANKYIVTAADGTKKTWTIRITAFNH